jgi:hypothetical protein
MSEKFNITIDMGSLRQLGIARATAINENIADMDELLDIIADRLLEINPPYSFELDTDFEAEIELKRSTVRNAFIDMNRGQMKNRPMSMATLQMFTVEISRQYKDEFGAYPGADYPENGITEVNEVGEYGEFRLFSVPWVPTGLVAIKLDNAYLYAAVKSKDGAAYEIAPYEFKQFDSVEDAVRWVNTHRGKERAAQEQDFHIGKENPSRPQKTIYI